MNDPLIVFNSILKLIDIRIIQHLQEIMKIFDNIYFRKLINIYRTWRNAYPDLTFYVEGIGSTIVKKGSYSNANVLRLNSLLKAEYEPQGMWIDTYRFLEENNIVDDTKRGRRDNYHYKWVTSKQILIRLRELIEDDTASKTK